MQISFQIKLQGMFKYEEGILSFMHGDLHNNKKIYYYKRLLHRVFLVWNIKVVLDGLKHH